MEELSRDFIMTIAHSRGFFNFNGRDYGTDLLIRQAIKRANNGRSRYLTTGKGIDIQLKAVSEDWISYLDKSVKYTLEIKNYIDLIERAKEEGGAIIPLILIIFIVPSDSNKWVEMQQDGILLRKEAYWYQISPDKEIPSNKTNITIEIPKANKVNAELFPNLFVTLWE
jgi:hypothetical protein